MITERNGETEDPQSAYSVELDIFNGPLDLLLHLIKKNEVDIYDIPIALIIEQYLEYLDFLKDVNLEIVGDYMSMAAELGYIKSRMLLPRIKDEDEDEGQDPREELVRQLLEYERYRERGGGAWRDGNPRKRRLPGGLRPQGDVRRTGGRNGIR